VRRKPLPASAAMVFGRAETMSCRRWRAFGPGGAARYGMLRQREWRGGVSHVGAHAGPLKHRVLLSVDRCKNAYRG